MKKILSKLPKFIVRSLLVIVLVVIAIIVGLPVLVASEWGKAKIETHLTELLGSEVQLNGDLELRLGLIPGVTVTDLVLNSPLSDDPMLEIGKFSVSGPIVANLEGNYQIDDLRTSNIRVLFVEDSHGNSNWTFADRNDEVKEIESAPIVLPSINHLKLDNTTVILQGAEASHEFVFASIGAENVSPATQSNLASSLGINGIPMTLAVKIGSLEEFFAGRGLSVDVGLKQDRNNVKVRGEIFQDGRSDLIVKAKGPDLSELSTVFFVRLPEWKDYTIEGRVNLPADYKAPLKVEQFKLLIGENDLEGTVEVVVSPLYVKANLVSTTGFDLGALTASPQPEEVDTSDESKSEPRIPYELFDSLNAEVELKAARLTTFLDLHFEDVALTAELDQGKLSVSNYSGNVFGGSFHGSLEAVSNVLKVSLDGADFHASPITLLAGGTPFLEGAFDFSTELEANGSGLSEILKTLTGRVELSSESARVKHATLNTAGSGLLEILSPIFTDSKKEAESDCIIMNYNLKDGVAKSDIQVIKLGEVFLFGEGQLNFPKNELTYNFNVNSQNPTLASLIPPFRAFGKLNKPYFAPSISGSIASVGDTAEGVLGSALGMVDGTARFVIGGSKEQISGLEVCKLAYAAEQRLLSSRVGSLLKHDSDASNAEHGIEPENVGVGQDNISHGKNQFVAPVTP